MKRTVGQGGFTLVELLVAGTLMLIILSALGNLFISTNRAYRTNDRVSERQQSADAAAQLLSYEVALAGYRGSVNSTTPPSFSGSTLTITKGATAEASDKITVQYYEDRFTTGAVNVTFEADLVSGVYSLYRTTSTKQPAFENIKNLKVLRYIRKDGEQCNTVTPGTSTTPSNLAGLKIELTFTTGLTKQVVVPLLNAQTSSASDLPTLTVLPNPSDC